MTSDTRLVLCGDSILDNGAYVGPSGRPVESHLREHLEGWTIDFRAVDGAVVPDVAAHQLRSGIGARDAVVVSAGGNDALAHIGLLSDPTAGTFLEFALRLAAIQDAFRADYAALLSALNPAGSVMALTIYRPQLGRDGYPEEIQRAACALLSIFNDVIFEEAHRAGFEVLDLRRLFTDPGDYFDSIEPSDAGGRKIAFAIADWAARIGFDG